MALSYIMDLRGPQLAAPPSWLQRLIGKLKMSPMAQGSYEQALHGPWQLLNERQGEGMNTIVPAGIAPYYGGGAGVPMQPGWTMRPGANLPSMPTPPPLQGALGGITDVISANPLALVVGIGVGIYLGMKVKR